MAVTDFVNLAKGAQEAGNNQLAQQLQAFNLAKEQVPLERQAQFRELTKGLDLNNPDLAPFVKGGFAQEILPSVPDLWQAKLLGQKIAAANQGTPWTQQQKVEQTLDSVQHQPGPVLPPGVPADQNQQPPAQNGPMMPPGVPQQAPKDPVAEYMDFKHNPQFARYASLDPMFKTQYDTQNSILHDAAISHVGQEYNTLLQGAKTPEQVSKAASTILSKYAPLAADPALDKIVQDSKRMNPIFNINGQDIRAKQQEVTGLRGNNATETKDYDVAKRAALAFDQDYKRYEAIKASGNEQAIKVAQQGMLDKYITASTGKSTGDAQFNNFRNSQGLTNVFQNLAGRVENGSMAPDEAFQEMRKITMGTAEALRQKAQQANAATKGMAQSAQGRIGFIDPNEAIVHPDKMLSQDSASFAIPAQASNPHPEDNEAVAWAKANPNAPQSAKILKANGL